MSSDGGSQQVPRVSSVEDSGGLSDEALNKTQAHRLTAMTAQAAVRRFRLTVVDGPQSGQSWDSSGDTCSLGSHPSNDLIIDDPTVSRFHCELKVDPSGVRVKDLESRNGTILDGVAVLEAFLRSGSMLRLGRTVVRFDLGFEENELPVSESTRFGSLVAVSVATRTSVAQMERAASSDATVLLEGETGTGKSRAAQAIHEASSRRDRAFIIVDCGAIPPNLLESELFGHEKGAFTGAVSRRIGAFEEANGGTVFLDEIGELPLDLQPKLLRAIEARQVRRVGLNTYLPVNVRVIAATNRDLRAEVNAGRFRSDLFYRLAVVRIVVPPLRQRADDIPAIVEQTLVSLGADTEVARRIMTPEFIAHLKHSPWPGNVRELRNHIEQCLVFQEALPPPNESAAPVQRGTVEPALTYADARRHALDAFERDYLEALIARHGGKVAEAAAAAEVDRVYLYRLLRRHGIKHGASK